MSKMRKTLIKVPILLLLLFILTSCGFWMLPLRREKTETYAIRGASFSETFNTCIKAAKDIRFEIRSPKKSAGRFEGVRGFGIKEITTLRFKLKRGYRNKLDFTVTVKSSRGGHSVIKSFVKSVEKYLDTFPIEIPEELPERAKN